MMDMEDIIRRSELKDEQMEAWHQTTQEIDNWLKLHEILMREFNEKCAWVNSQWKLAMAKRDREDRKYQAQIDAIDSKYKESEEKYTNHNQGG